MPEIDILFGDAVGASLVRGPWLPPRGCYVICDVDLHEFVATLDKQMQHRHMFASWSIDHGKFMNQAIFPQPPNYLSEAALQHNLQIKKFPDRSLRTKAPRADVEAYHRKCERLRQNAAAREQQNPVSFALRNSWADTLAADKTHYKEFTAKSQT